MQYATEDGTLQTCENILETTTCWKCGIMYAAPRRFFEVRRNDKQSFYCPNGHSAAFIKTESDKLRDKLADAERMNVVLENRIATERERTAIAERSKSAMAGQVTRIKNRVKNGVCICCNRSFSDLHQHMLTKHPDFSTPEKVK